MELSLRGFKDLLPADMLARDKIVSVIKEVFESYGFVPIATPALEHKKVLLAYSDVTAEFTVKEYNSFLTEFPHAKKIIQPFVREENDICFIPVSGLSLKQQQELGDSCFEKIVDHTMADKQIYIFREPDGKMVGLKFDLTVPLSRFVAEHKDIPRPFKRYQFQPVWRYDKPDTGRFREFTQFDIDTVGTDSMIADTEIITAMHDCLKKLGLNFKIRFSNRKVLNSLIKFAQIDLKKAHSVFRVIDKLEKQGIDNVKLELGAGRIDSSGDKIPGLGLDEDQISKIEDFLNLTQPTRFETIMTLKSLFKNVEDAEEGINELNEIHYYLDALEISEEKVIIDLSIARGLDYYTGPVFEAILTDEEVKDFGSVMGGGRFDRLIEHFIGESIPATGASIGVDRLLSAMQKLNLITTKPSTADVLVTILDRERIVEYQKIAKLLREAGIKTELYMGNEKSIGKQLKYADSQKIPIAVIAGSKEFSNNQISIKDLRVIKTEKIEIKGREEWVEKKIGQITIDREKLINEINKML